MTTRTRTKLLCECGHTGIHTHSENDQPNSTNSERFGLKGFSGDGEYKWDTEKMLCPQCGMTAKVKEVA
jgi:hypothetical protein